jgi:hypothetical protein
MLQMSIGTDRRRQFFGRFPCCAGNPLRPSSSASMAVTPAKLRFSTLFRRPAVIPAPPRRRHRKVVPVVAIKRIEASQSSKAASIGTR